MIFVQCSVAIPQFKETVPLQVLYTPQDKGNQVHAYYFSFYAVFNNTNIQNPTLNITRSDIFEKSTIGTRIALQLQLHNTGNTSTLPVPMKFQLNHVTVETSTPVCLYHLSFIMLNLCLHTPCKHAWSYSGRPASQFLSLAFIIHQTHVIPAYPPMILLLLVL